MSGSEAVLGERGGGWWWWSCYPLHFSVIPVNLKTDIPYP